MMKRTRVDKSCHVQIFKTPIDPLCFHVKERIETSGLKQGNFSSRPGGGQPAADAGVSVSEGFRAFPPWIISFTPAPGRRHQGGHRHGANGAVGRQVSLAEAYNFVILAEVLSTAPQVRASTQWSDWRHFLVPPVMDERGEIKVACTWIS